MIKRSIINHSNKRFHSVFLSPCIFGTHYIDEVALVPQGSICNLNDVKVQKIAKQNKKDRKNQCVSSKFLLVDCDIHVLKHVVRQRKHTSMLTELKTTDLTRYIIITKPVINLNKVIDQLKTTNHLYTEKNLGNVPTLQPNALNAVQTESRNTKLKV